MLTKSMMKLTFNLSLIILFTAGLLAQGVTTSSISGQITDSADIPLSGANIVVIHVASNTTYGTTSRDEGYYTIPNMKIGGPYSMAVSYIGYKVQKEADLYLRLGMSTKLSFQLVEEALEMAGIYVTAERDDVMNADRTGAAILQNGMGS